MIGAEVAHYRVVERLGGGSMGVVYRAEDTRLERAVALKFLPWEVSGDEDAKRRFLREARAASRLDHPNVCTVHEIGETPEGRLFMVMACYRGETLKQRIARGPLAAGEALGIARQIALALAKAHAEGILHRDVKPANVMLVDDGEAGPGRVKVLDFGLAKVTGQGALTRTGSSVGTPLYMSPEQIAGTGDARSDVWSLGVLLYEMLTGVRPFGGVSSAAVMYRILHAEPPRLAAARPGLPDAVQRIVDRALARDPDARYASMRALAEDLAAAAAAAGAARPGLSPPPAPAPTGDETQVIHRRPPGRRPPAVRAGRARRRWGVAALAAATVAAAALMDAARSTTVSWD